MNTLEVIALILGVASLIYFMCAISYSIGLKKGIKYMTDIVYKEREETEDEG